MTPRTPEADATREIILGTRDRVLWFPNPVGRAVPLHSKTGMPVLYGVGGVGGSDWIGIERATGRLVALEIKRADGKGRATDEQRTFLAAVAESGAVAVLATCAAEVLAALNDSAVRTSKHEVTPRCVNSRGRDPREGTP